MNKNNNNFTFKRWDKEEEKLMIKLFDDKKTIEEIASELERSVNAVKWRMKDVALKLYDNDDGSGKLKKRAYKISGLDEEELLEYKKEKENKINKNKNFDVNNKSIEEINRKVDEIIEILKNKQ